MIVSWEGGFCKKETLNNRKPAEISPQSPAISLKYE